jgi:hypothetical protein
VDQSTIEAILKQAGFIHIAVELKPQSKEVIKNWMPGSGAENFVVSANIQAQKPTDKQRMTAFLNNYVVEQERKEVEKQEHMNRNASTPEPVSVVSAAVPAVANSCGTNKSDEC